MDCQLEGQEQVDGLHGKMKRHMKMKRQCGGHFWEMNRHIPAPGRQTDRMVTGSGRREDYRKLDRMVLLLGWVTTHCSVACVLKLEGGRTVQSRMGASGQDLDSSCWVKVEWGVMVKVEERVMYDAEVPMPVL